MLMLVSINGTDLFYELQGAGRPLMFMHGGMGFDHTYFRPWLDPLSDRMELIYYDHRGNGRSTLADDFTGISPATWADDADSLRRHLGHEKIVLFGHSCGAFVAQEYARKYGRNLAGLVLCAAMPAMDYPAVIMANAQARATPEQLEVVGRMFTNPLTSNDEFQNALHTLLSLYFKNYDPVIGDRVIKAIHYNYHSYNNTSAVLFPTFNSLGWLHEIRVPTLILGGREDWITPPAQGAERFHAAIPNSELVIFENSGHFPFIEEQARFNTVMSEWIGGLV